MRPDRQTRPRHRAANRALIPSSWLRFVDCFRDLERAERAVRPDVTADTRDQLGIPCRDDARCEARGFRVASPRHREFELLCPAHRPLLRNPRERKREHVLRSLAAGPHRVPALGITIRAYETDKRPFRI